MTVLLGVDPGSLRMGWGAISVEGSALRHLGHGTLRAGRDTSLASRLAVLHAGLEEVLDREARAYAANPEAHAFSRFFREELERALDELPEDFRTAVVLADVQGLSYKEVAGIMGCPIGTVMSRLHRARLALRERMLAKERADA